LDKSTPVSLMIHPELSIPVAYSLVSKPEPQDQDLWSQEF